MEDEVSTTPLLPFGPPVRPMLARLTRALPVGERYVFEPKWDGFRCLAFRAGAAVELYSRNERALTRYFPEIVEALADLAPDDRDDDLFRPVLELAQPLPADAPG